MRLLAALAVVAVLAGGAYVIAGFTQSAESEVDPSSVSTVTFAVEGKRFEQPLDVAATGLWGVCSSNVASHLVGDIDPMGAGTYRMRLQPALDADDEKKLVGCISDATIDRIQGEVLRVVTSLP